MWEAVEQKLQEEEEQRVWKDEEKEWRLASEKEKRWLVELAEQNQQNRLVEGNVEGSSKSRGTCKDEDGPC